MTQLEQLLGISGTAKPEATAEVTSKQAAKAKPTFSFIFFSDVDTGNSDSDKYHFMRDVTQFGDRAGFTAVYLPERHFNQFGSIYANAAVVAAYLIPQTERIRFRTAGVTLPLHHPTEVVEWWAMNDILSGGRVDLGFGSGWNKADFVTAPENYDDRRAICGERIEIVKKLWRGETITFPGPGGEPTPVQVHPRPIQKELNVWLLVAQNDGAFSYAGAQGYNIFTMLYGNDLAAMGKKIALYREGRRSAGLDPAAGIVSLMMHTHIDQDMAVVEQRIEKPFKQYINSTIKAHVKAGLGKDKGTEQVNQAEQDKILDYAYQRYVKTAALFGSVADGKAIVDQAIAVGVDDIVCLLDFGVDYSAVKSSLPYLQQLVNVYR